MQMTKIGERIASLRERAEMSQDELARWLGIPCRMLSQWESGESTPDGKDMLELADALGVRVEELTQETSIQEQTPRQERTSGQPVKPAPGSKKTAEKRKPQLDARTEKQTKILFMVMAALTLVLLIVVIVFSIRLSALRKDMDDAVSDANARLSELSEDMQSRIAAVAAMAKESKNVLLTDGHCALEYDYASDTVVLRTTAYPLEQVANETAGFIAQTDDGQHYYASAANFDGCYSGEIRIPAQEADNFTVYYEVTKNGSTRTEEMAYYRSALRGVRVSIDRADALCAYQGDGATKMTFSVDVASAVNEYDAVKGYAVSAMARIYEGELLLREEELARYDVNSAAMTRNTSFTDLGQVLLRLTDPEKLRAEIAVTDNEGRVFTRECGVIWR